MPRRHLELTPEDRALLATLGSHLPEICPTEPDSAALRAPFLKFNRICLMAATNAYLEGKEETIQAQQAAMLALSTPVVEVWQGILALPLVGTIDTARAQACSGTAAVPVPSSSGRPSRPGRSSFCIATGSDRSSGDRSPTQVRVRRSRALCSSNGHAMTTTPRSSWPGRRGVRDAARAPD